MPSSTFRFSSSVLAAMLIVAPVHAQSADDATRAAARQLGYEGVSDFQAANYAPAEEKLDRAFRALKAPSLGLWSARAFVKTGKLVAASERYLEVKRLDPGSGDVAVQKQAQADAETEYAALLPRIPGVVIQIEGAKADRVTVTVNGSPVPNSLIGMKRLVDPGTVQVDGQAGSAVARETVTLVEAETKTVTLRFDPNAVAAAPVAATPVAAPAPVPAAPTTGAEKPADARAATSGDGRRTIGFVVLGAGGVGLVLGAVTGGLAMSTRSSTEGCQDTSCPTSQTDKVEKYNQLRTISSVSFIAGGALAATGLVFVLTAPSSSSKTASAQATFRAAPFVGVGTAGLTVGVER
jgi:hypothetical protein